ncbi:MAG TPA: DEAD/DEAH box helicase family protein [Solirubrobacterales bacterium]|nr:DEAD/DEAH box helicase family protein [Solirubrobacterales bacterium]
MPTRRGRPSSDRGRPYCGRPLYDSSQHPIGSGAPVRSLPDWPDARPLRSWQQEATEAVRAHSAGSFLASATPAAGKTTFGLHIAHRMLSAKFVSRVVVAGPTTHICRQWAADAARYGIDLEPNRPNSDGPESADFHGVAVTYQTIAAGPAMHRQAAGRRPTLLIADEPHHMGDLAAWGVRTREAFDSARFRLLLSGTPFRSDNSAIPWVAYDEDGLSRADYVYGYPQALRDRVCRPITFLPYDGEMEWISDGRLRSADFDLALPAAESARRLRTALSPEGEWMGEVLRDGDARLSEVRADGHPDAGGLVIASDQDHARAIAARLGSISGERPELVMSDEPDASRRIADFASSDQRWLVSVLMVSEGVDIPRLRVGVYATAARTELFFRQVVGRFIRTTPQPRRQMSYLLMPADPRLKALAHEIELERRHALDLSPGGEEEEGEEFDDPDPEPGEPGGGFAALSSGDAELDEAIMSETALQLFPTDDPKPAAKKAVALARPESPPEDREPERESAYATRERLRGERRGLVADVARRTGKSHREVQARINRDTRTRSVSSATIEQLERGNAMLRRELWR